MKYSALLMASLLMAGGCTKTTYLPWQNLQDQPDGVRGAYTLVLTEKASDERSSAIDMFLNKHNVPVEEMVLAGGSAVSSHEKAAVRNLLLARGIDENVITMRELDDSSAFCLVLKEKEFLGDLHQTWLDSSAVSPKFGKATQYNIAAQLANSNDIHTPRQLGPSNRQAAVGPVERYQSGQVASDQMNAIYAVGASSSSSSSE